MLLASEYPAVFLVTMQSLLLLPSPDLVHLVVLDFV